MSNIWIERKQEREEAIPLDSDIPSVINGHYIPSVIGGAYNINIPSIIVLEINLPSVIVLEPIQVPSFITVSATGA